MGHPAEGETLDADGPTLSLRDKGGAPGFCRRVYSFSFTDLWLRPFDLAQGRLRWGTRRIT
jgi:hypothetical protein